jgi:hypothetical protein
MVEVGGAITGATPTADEETTAFFTLKCQQWTPLQEINFWAFPNTPIEATSGIQVTELARLPCDLSFSSKALSTINCVLTQQDALTSAGQFADYVRYI